MGIAVGNENTPVVVASRVFMGLEAVRRSGITNMFSFNTVQVAVYRLGFYESVVWLEENKTEYVRGIRAGIQPAQALTTTEEEQVDRAAQALREAAALDESNKTPIQW